MALMPLSIISFAQDFCVSLISQERFRTMKVKDFNIQQWQDCLTKFLATCTKKDPPPAIRIENTQFTTARYYGGMTMNGEKYTYFEPVILGEPNNPDGSPYVAWLMVRDDFLKFATKEAKAMEKAQGKKNKIAQGDLGI